MANIATNTLFPSAKFIATNANGDLQEAVGADATKASLTHSGLTFEAVNAGVAGNDIEVQVVFYASVPSGNNGSTKQIDYETHVDGQHQLRVFFNQQGTKSSLTQEGVVYSAKNAGVAGDAISIEIKQGQAGAGVTGIEFDATGNAIVVKTELALDNYTQGDVVTALASATQAIKDLIEITATSSGTSLTNAGTLSATNLAGGVDPLQAGSYTTQDMVDAFATAPQAIKDEINVTTANGSSVFGTYMNKANLAGGQDAVAGDLDSDSDYVLIKQSDIYDLEATETADARKMVWGIIHNASEIWGQQTTQPDSLQIVRSAVSSTDQGLALKQTYTITAKYSISGLDLKAES